MLTEFTPWPSQFAARYRDKGYWSGQTLEALPAEWAAMFGDHTAVVAGGHRWSYRELAVRSSRLAAGFRALGIERHDRVVVQLPNVAEFFEVLFGLFELGAIPVVVLPAYRRSEVTYFCELTEAVAYIVADHHLGFDFRTLAAEVRAKARTVQHVVVLGEPGEFVSVEALRAQTADSIDTWPATDPNDVALLHLSGGTTGTPKLIPRTHNDYLYGARAAAELCRLTPDTVYLCSLPVAHQFSLSAPGALGTFLSGGRVVLAPHPAPDVTFPLIENERVTVAALVPAVVPVWLAAAYHTDNDLSSLMLLQVGGAKLSPDLARRVRPVLDCRVQQVFGMTEGLLNFTRLDDPDDIVFTTQGKPLSPDDEIRVVDETGSEVPPGEPGELLIRGPYTIRGYYRAPEYNVVAFTADGFYRTGDIVRQTPTGHLVVVGRSKDQINVSGQKISAEEIENHLLAHPDIVEVAVVAMPDRFVGERICAYVVSRDVRPEASELIAFVRARGLAAHKVPDRVEFIDVLPRTAVGKISKQRLRDRIAATAQRDGANP
ncbi:(2,3-dihydroxybenzoyl)adenylate synthase [Nocardia brevicatena]|uniref:(2,3-dihydroxybenzoyl)adenylate synthase n=1 Tax=Nocardia brevicatena TaxID=37327 RepID=UPI0002F64659|nr:AMP-binding protein [Nocardia brevicatena]